jgi:hypothetical protein
MSAERPWSDEDTQRIADAAPPLTPELFNELYLLLAPFRRDAKGRRIHPDGPPRKEAADARTPHPTRS